MSSGRNRAAELADLIAALLRDELSDAVVFDPEPEGPLFAKLYLSGAQGLFAIVVEEQPRPKGFRSAGSQPPPQAAWRRHAQEGVGDPAVTGSAADAAASRGDPVRPPAPPRRPS